MSDTEVAIVLTARMNSERLPGKAMMPVEGMPLIYWIAKRLARIGQVIVAPTTDPADAPILALAADMRLPVTTAAPGQVTAQLIRAVRAHMPQARYVLRALGDCPFMATELIARAVTVMERTGAEAFLWYLPPQAWPVYGSREFPYSISGLARIGCGATGDELQHPDLYFHRHRDLFRIAYHEPPANVYFRPYRLEVDWPEDLELVRQVARGVGMLAPVESVIKFLDAHQDVAMLNRERVERTGPQASYPYAVRRSWMKQMEGKRIICWDDYIWEPPDSRATPVFCRSGECLLGYGYKGVLFARFGRICGRAFIECRCGAGRSWSPVVA